MKLLTYLCLFCICLCLFISCAKEEKQFDCNTISVTYLSNDTLSQYDVKALANKAFRERNFTQKKRFLDQALILCEKDTHELCDWIHRNSAILYTRLGDYDRAKNLLEKALQLAKKANHSVEKRLALIELASHNRILGNIEVAIEKYKQGLADLNTVLDTFSIEQNPDSYDKLVKAKNYFLGNLGQSYITIKKYQEGFNYFDALITDPDVASNNVKVGSLRYYAEGYAGLNQFDLAKKYYDEALEAAETKTSARDFGKILLSYAKNHHFQKGDYKAALNAYQTVLTRIVPNFQPKNSLDNPSHALFTAENTIFQALEGKAEVLYHLYQKDKQVKYLEKALECHELILYVEHLLRKEYSSDNSKLILQEDSHARREKALKAAYEYYKLDGNETKANFERILHFFEYSRATLLKESLRELEKNSADLLPQNITEEKACIEKQLALYKVTHQNIEEEQRELEARNNLEEQQGQLEERKKQLEEQQEQLEEQKKRLEAHIKIEVPQYYNLKYQIRKTDLAALEAYLKDNTNRAIVTYFIGKEYSYATAISANGRVFIELDFRQEDKSKVDEFIRLITQQENLTNLAYELDTLLWQPVEQAIRLPKEVIIVPDGILSALPFDALCTEPTENINKVAYLLDKYDITFSHSIDLLLQSNNKKTVSKQEVNYLGIAPINFPNLNLESIVTSSNEITEIEVIFGGEKLIELDATKIKLLNNFNKHHFKIVHFNTHAAANRHKNNSSWIALNDQKLYLSEIYALHGQLSADLVVLNSCESGIGELRYGEGALSLSRAFAYAGCPSVLSTLWVIRSEQASTIVRYYLHFLKDGNSKVKALAEAKRKYLNETHGPKRHPYFWAGIIQTGNVAALSF